MPHEHLSQNVSVFLMLYRISVVISFKLFMGQNHTGGTYIHMFTGLKRGSLKGVITLCLEDMKSSRTANCF